MRKLLAFLKRDLLEASSYKLSFLFSLLSILFTSATLFFISKLVPGGAAAHLEAYGGDYFSFVITGVAFSGLLGLFKDGFSGVIRNAQIAGTLEALLVTPTGIPTILLGSSLYGFLYTLISTLLQIGMAVLVFGMKIENANWPGALLIFILTLACYLAIGVLSASFVLVHKLGNPFGWLFGGASVFLSGVFFPVSLLPPWVRWLSSLLPMTYSLDGMRRSLLVSSGLAELLPALTALGLFAAGLLPLSLAAFRLALRKAKRDGTLVQF